MSLSLWHRGCVTGISIDREERVQCKCARVRVHSIECIRYGHGRMRITDRCGRAFNKSAVDVEEGAWVLVTDDVVSGGVNLKGMQGKVVYAWEKCEVDPTCCCAELSMEDASVQVPFLYVFLWCS